MSDEVYTDASDDAFVKQKYSLTLKGGGLTLERQVDENTALAILQISMGGAAPVPGLSVTPKPTPPVAHAPSLQPVEVQGEQRLSLRNYFDQVGAKNNLAKIVAVGAYLREVDGQTEFSREDIAAGFRNAREIVPGNLPRDVGKAVQAGWIAEDPRSKNQFYVTAVGDDALSSGFEGTRASSSRKKRGKKAKGGGQQSASEGE
ncbi:hypothetical protein [Microvirga alba]|uniref:Uncharacterized protein n=1 Tax=Microvirga alba TaxID=2791025 RepID=A0A931BQ96_9HYPH|nr:hypothetical protein [Microvirga alba]MBF9233325.1 hypothetical protein [Microvirga alba]